MRLRLIVGRDCSSLSLHGLQWPSDCPGKPAKTKATGCSKDSARFEAMQQMVHSAQAEDRSQVSPLRVGTERKEQR